MELVYSHDFWEFYKLNTPEVNGIVAVAWKKFNIPVPFEEHLSEILLKLFRSDFLKTFDYRKSKINTYLTNKVRFYTLQLINEWARANEHFIEIPDLENTEIIDPVDYEEEYLTSALGREIEENLGKGLGKGLGRKKIAKNKVFRLITNGYSLKEMADKFSISARLMGYYKKKVQKVVRSLLKERVTAYGS